MRIFFAHIDWNDKMKNKTATESWNILKSELNSVINRCSYEKARETVHEETSVKICFQKDKKIYGGFINIIYGKG